MVSTLSLAYVTGVMTGTAAEASIGFPSLYTLPHTAVLRFHGVNVRGSESWNKMMLVHSNNPYEDTKTELIAQKMVGKRMFIGWPFLQNLFVYPRNNVGVFLEYIYLSGTGSGALKWKNIAAPEYSLIWTVKLWHKLTLCIWWNLVRLSTKQSARIIGTMNITEQSICNTLAVHR